MRVIIFSVIVSFGLSIFAADNQKWDPKEYDENSGPQFELTVGYLENKHAELARCKVIVDLGCCVGKTTKYLAEKYPEAVVVGVDPEENAIKYANETCKEQDNMQFMHARGQDYDLSKYNLELADFVACYHVLHWIDRNELPRVFDNVIRNLVPGGTVDVVTSARQGTTNLTKAVLWTAVTKWPLLTLKNLPTLIRGQDNNTLLTNQELRNLAEQSGLVVDSCKEITTTVRFKSRDEFGEWLATIIKAYNLFDNDKDRHAFSRDAADVYCTYYSGEKEDGEIVYAIRSLRLEAHKPQ